MANRKKTMHDKIAEKLAKGENVYSQAAGKVGRVIDVDEQVVHLTRGVVKIPANKIVVANFNFGDKVRLVKRIVTEWVIENV